LKKPTPLRPFPSPTPSPAGRHQRVTAPQPPQALSKAARSRWRQLVDEYAITDPAGLQILEAALEAFDRMRAAQRTIKKDGATFKDRYGQPRAHPLLVVERDSRAAMLAALKQLNLDLEPLRDRPGRPGGT
jgi:P27 family predicted phage terminase small subunit